MQEHATPSTSRTACRTTFRPSPEWRRKRPMKQRHVVDTCFSCQASFAKPHPNALLQLSVDNPQFKPSSKSEKNGKSIKQAAARPSRIELRPCSITFTGHDKSSWYYTAESTAAWRRTCSMPACLAEDTTEDARDGMVLDLTASC